MQTFLPPSLWPLSYSREFESGQGISLALPQIFTPRFGAYLLHRMKLEKVENMQVKLCLLVFRLLCKKYRNTVLHAEALIAQSTTQPRKISVKS